MASNRLEPDESSDDDYYDNFDKYKQKNTISNAPTYPSNSSGKNLFYC